MTIQDKGSAQQFIITTLPWAIDVLWQGKSGVHVIDDDRRATLTIEYSYTRGNYDQFNVEITSKSSGPIVNKRFKFDDHLPRNERADSRESDYPIGGNPCFKVVDHCGWHWYIAMPAHPEKFTQAIEEWIDTWR